MIKKFKNLLICLVITLFLIIISSLAHADSFVEYGNNDESILYINENSIHKFTQDNNEIVLFEAAIEMKPGGAVKSFGPKAKNFYMLKIQYAISCTNYRFMTLQVDVYNKNASIIKREGKSEVSDIKPGTYMDISYTRLCRGENEKNETL